MFLNLEYREEQDCQLAGLGMFFGSYVFFGWLWILDSLIFFGRFTKRPHCAEHIFCGCRGRIPWTRASDFERLSIPQILVSHSRHGTKHKKNTWATVLIKCALKHITAWFRLGNSEIWNHHFSIAEFLCSTSSHLRVLHADAAHDFGPALLMIATHCLVTTSWDG